MKPLLYEGFEYPTTTTQEVLLTLITQGYVSIFDYAHLSGFRTRISDIKKKFHLNLETIMDTRTNKFGNTYKYAIHKLPPDEKEKAIELYKKINKS